MRYNKEKLCSYLSHLKEEKADFSDGYQLIINALNGSQEITAD